MKRKLLILIMLTISLTAFCQPSAMYDSADWVNHRARIDSNFTELYDTSVVHNTRLIALERNPVGSSISQLKFIVGTTVNAPTAGVDTLQNAAFYGSKHIEGWKTNNGTVTSFYIITVTNDSTANFTTSWVDGDSVVIDVTESTAWTSIALSDTITLNDTITCTSAGIAYFKNNSSAYGVWEYDLYRNAVSAVYIDIISTDSIASLSNTGYSTRHRDVEYLELFNNGTAELFQSTATLLDDTWYSFRIERNETTNQYHTGSIGSFRVQVKGGAFGASYVILPAATGTNPVVDASKTTSKYFTLDMDNGDIIANIKINEIYFTLEDLFQTTGTYE